MDDASLFFDGADGRQIPISRSGQSSRGVFLLSALGQ
jgi:hypothetical protein